MTRTTGRLNQFYLEAEHRELSTETIAQMTKLVDDMLPAWTG
jgi:hypothetical protein